MFPRKTLTALVLALGAGVCSTHARASASSVQDLPDAPRLRVGLVLSGGGARGASHIGVLRVLEELNIPIDAIAGTSMGSIIGGLYAAGLSPDEIEEAIAGVSWKAAFSDNPGRARSSMRRKQDSRDFLIDLELGLKRGGFTFSRGILQGQNLGLLLKDLAASAELVQDFDELPIPFRAVATDAVTGEAIVLDSGGLAVAMRASMSVPGVFEPVEIDGRLLIDGGMSAQTPISVVRRMGVDVVIVVDLTIEQDMQAGDIGTPFSLLSNLLLMVVTRNAQIELGTLSRDDILIKPNLDGFSSADFSGSIDMIEPGAEAARRMAWRLRPLAMPHAEFEQRLASFKGKHAGPVRVDRIVIENDSKLADDVLLFRLGIEVGTTLDLQGLREGIGRIYGLGYFESVNYFLERHGGENIVVIRAKRKIWGPTYARFGLQLGSDFRSSNAFNVGTRVLATEMNRWGGEWVSDFQVGENSFLRTSFYQPLDRGLRWFIEPTLQYSRESISFYDGQSSRIAEYQVEGVIAVLQGGYVFGNWGELRGGVEAGEGAGHLRTGDPSFPSGSFGIGSGFFAFEADTLDRWEFPSDGEFVRARVDLQREGLGAEQDIDTLRFEGASMHTSGKYTTALWTRVGVAGRAPQIQDLHRVGGLFNLSGLADGQLFGRTAGMAGLGLRKRFGDLEATLQRPTYIGFTAEWGGAWSDGEAVTFDSSIIAGSLYFAMDTVVGPFYLAWGHAEGGHGRLYLILGRAMHRL